MGANIAAWKQAARVELALTTKHKVEYAQVLPDLVKAFDRIPHWLLVREAISSGFPPMAPQVGHCHLQAHQGVLDRCHPVCGSRPLQG